jgi:hypothetical protein
MLLLVEAGLLVAAWKTRRADGWARLLGGALAASVVALLLMEITAEYMGFAGVSQLFWIMVGLFALASKQKLPLPAEKEQPLLLETRVIAYG